MAQSWFMRFIEDFILGGAIIYLGLDVLYFHLIPEGFVQYALMLIGALILLIPAGNAGIPTPFFQRVKKWVFGIFVLAMGILSAIGSLGEKIPQITMYSTQGPWILIGIGVIFVLSAFPKQAGYQIRTA
ncbi:MAG: hypothetical protein AABX76_00085 [Nanoarchaeota archaeon]